MKQARMRQRHARRDRTPAAIGLAPPAPPVTAPRGDAKPIAAEAALPATRQLRRQERRAQAKAARRGTPATVLADAATVPVEAAADAHPAPRADEALAPLPRSRALTKPRSRLLMVLDRLVRPLRRATLVRATPRDELEALRRQLSAAQATLDRLLGAQ